MKRLFLLLILSISLSSNLLSTSSYSQFSQPYERTSSYTSNEVIIQLLSGETVSGLQVYNPKGQLIVTLNQVSVIDDRIIISTLNWPSGVYHLRVITNQRTINQTIIIP